MIDWMLLLLPQFDVLTMIRPRREAMRRILVRDVSLRGGALTLSERDGSDGQRMDFEGDEDGILPNTRSM